MSTATDFQFRDGWFPPIRMNGVPPSSKHDYVDVSIQDAYNLFWLLESLQVTTTGTKSPSNINWTTTFGPTQSLPFTPTSSIKDGAYYNNSYSAACPPSERSSTVTTATYGDDGCCPILALFQDGNSGTTDWKQIYISLVFDSTNASSTIRIYYRFFFRMTYNLFSPYNSISVSNPAEVATYTGAAPSSGTFSILGVSFNWKGGGYTFGSIWGTETATISVTSSAFTF